VASVTAGGRVCEIDVFLDPYMKPQSCHAAFRLALGNEGIVYTSKERGVGRGGVGTTKK